ncbi:CAP domain-containing protein [Bacillus massilinigeriensis]|uniref:CAP domain-containing protein n=1 Tax=Bacillus massilionigeriensis TaxID=1805475 RepID=UPI000AAF681F|nr:CAP domain-containing protein [Bacillus massilionigeriensis]
MKAGTRRIVFTAFTIVLFLVISIKMNPFFIRDSQANAVEQVTKESETGKNNFEWDFPDDSLLNLIGKDVKELYPILGKPNRIEPSFYDYNWWVYNQDLESYVQIGVSQNKIVTMYLNGRNINIKPFQIGDNYEEIISKYNLQTEVSFEHEKGSYRFELSDEDLKTQPLLPINDFFAQLYIDKFTEKLSGIRILDKNNLIKQRPYELFYRGDLIENTTKIEDNIEKIERANEKQILDITNIIRKREKANPLKWDVKTAKVAFLHSKDMYESKVFSHDSKRYGELSDRLKAGEVFYQLAGENIAANYIDAPAVVEGWLNSKGHRESLLNERFTHLGVGVYKKHYTQNFIQKWEP